MKSIATKAEELLGHVTVNIRPIRNMVEAINCDSSCFKSINKYIVLTPLFNKKEGWYKEKILVNVLYFSPEDVITGLLQSIICLHIFFYK